MDMLEDSTIQFDIKSKLRIETTTIRITPKTNDVLQLYLENYISIYTKKVFVEIVGDTIPKYFIVYTPQKAYIDSLTVCDQNIGIPKYKSKLGTSNLVVYGNDHLHSCNISVVNFESVQVTSIRDLEIVDCDIKLLEMTNVFVTWLRTAKVKLLLGQSNVKTTLQPTYDSNDGIIIGKYIIFLEKDIYFDLDTIEKDNYQEKQFSNSKLKQTLSERMLGYLI